MVMWTVTFAAFPYVFSVRRCPRGGNGRWVLLAPHAELGPIRHFFTDITTTMSRGYVPRGHTERSAAICSLSHRRRALGTQMVAAGSSVAGSW
jgi:hypothetical protein